MAKKEVKNDGVIKIGKNITLTINKANSDSILFYATMNYGDIIYLKGLKLIQFEKDGKTTYFLGVPNYKTKDDKYNDFIIFSKKLRKALTDNLIKFYNENQEKFKKDETTDDFDDFVD